MEKPEEKRPPERFWRKLHDETKINFKTTELDSVHWCVLFQNGNKCRDLVNAIINLMVARKAGNFFTIWEPPSQEGLCCMRYLFI